MKSIILDQVSYTHLSGAQVFDAHSLKLETGKQDSYLYGIIGPSGTGKSTLLSLLGGQLKPNQGNILIDGVDIYQVDDLKRRELIALQIQTSTSLRGKLRYNLLFGLPEDIKTSKSDQELIDLLERVGLWHLFDGKDGLDTLIGEGGVNLSGGQRQRLNFAGLYLRAKYYQPHLILIDEPTSSLDEISEAAITSMIQELATDSLTLVVAHRLKTLDQAVAILDTSLLTTSKKLSFMSREELTQNSQYYQDLQSGNASLGE
jgi:ABC-type multidrug transport system fused ATPase/permease subunit